MLTEEENRLLTRTGPGTPAGELMRRYWQPIALSEEMPPGGAPLPVRCLSEDLVLFRDEAGGLGLLGLHCSHRGADLSYGRIEDGGLRCIYHGWLYDAAGRCLDQPGEPAESNSGRPTAGHRPAGRRSPPEPRHAIRHPAYPCQEQGGLVFAYLGPGAPPLLPAYEWLMAPAGHLAGDKVFQDCNYLQDTEGNVDPQHLSFLHRFFKSGEAEFRQNYHRGDVAPTIDPIETDFGLHVYAIRKVEPDQHFVKVRSFVFPNWTTVASRGEEGYSVNWQVPIDDEHHWSYSATFRRHAPIDPVEARESAKELLPDYHLVRNRANRYLQDREEMRTKTFAGMGKSFIVHDSFATEGQGTIHDRTKEHLGYTDRGIIELRQTMLRAIRDVEEGREAPHVVRDPKANVFPDILARDDLLPRSVPWRDHWKVGQRQQERVPAAP